MGEPEAVRHGANLDSSETITEQDEPPSGIRGSQQQQTHTPIKEKEPQQQQQQQQLQTQQQTTPPAHTVPISELGSLLNTNLEDGLSKDEAASRLERDGPNKIEGAKGVSLWEIFLRQISNSLTIVLLIVMVLSFAIDDYIEGGVITAVIVLNIVVGYVICSFLVASPSKAMGKIITLHPLPSSISRATLYSFLLVCRSSFPENSVNYHARNLEVEPMTNMFVAHAS
jgi:hypothetical protein